MSTPVKLHALIGYLILAVTLTGCDLFDDDNSSVTPLTTGLQSLQSDGVERTYYVVLPEESPATVAAASAGEELKPLIVGFHGSFASHRSWIGETDRYGFVDEVGNDAIMVFPDALLLSENNINWNFDYDFLFFEDLLAELERRGLKYDPNRVFVVGHSSGGGMASEIGCRYGDIVRGIAVSSGALISGGNCVGSVGVIQTHGEQDQSAAINAAASSQLFWALYNGHNPDTSIPGIVDPCVDYANVAFPNESYPVQWCQHPGGHPWTDFNAAAFWGFFSGLPTATPTMDPPPGGGNEAALGDADTTISFRLRYPEGMAPVTSGAITLYPDDFELGQFKSPEVFLELNWDPNAQAPGGQVEPGTEVLYNLVPIKFFVFGGEFDTSRSYKLAFSIYVEGGSRPIPTPGVDHMTLVPITFENTTTPVVIQETQDVVPVLPW
jgi:polyhydroxybutyrate depolymerase